MALFSSQSPEYHSSALPSPNGLSYSRNPMWLYTVDAFLHLSDLLFQQASLDSCFFHCPNPLLFLSLGSPALTPLFILPPSFGQTLTLPAIHPPSYQTVHPSSIHPDVHPHSTTQLPIHHLSTHHLPSDYPPTHPSTHPRTHHATSPPPTHPSICIYQLLSPESPD